MYENGAQVRMGLIEVVQVHRIGHDLWRILIKLKWSWLQQWKAGLTRKETRINKSLDAELSMGSRSPLVSTRLLALSVGDLSKWCNWQTLPWKTGKRRNKFKRISPLLVQIQPCSTSLLTYYGTKHLSGMMLLVNWIRFPVCRNLEGNKPSICASSPDGRARDF